MEAMRSLQREEDGLLPTSTPDDIVGYIEANYRDDGDLYAQVRTALKQVCSQGFVMELLDNEYHLVGPAAISINQTTSPENQGKCPLVSSTIDPQERRKLENPEGNSCDCESSTTGESAPKRKRRSPETRNAVQNYEEEDGFLEDNPECSCSTTDENVEPFDTLRSTGRNGRDEVHEEMYVGAGGNLPLNISQRRGTNDRGRKERTNDPGKSKLNATTVRDKTVVIDKAREEKDSLTDETVSDVLHNVLEKSRGQTRAKISDQHKKDLERWIQRCQEECKRRGKRRFMNK
ncbi:uncharacterized protein LOC128875006 isoform X1 [Hylaeus volcanicus]|uniref:uncharacterized protein LOC128875006 isoform X1 n=2 Tax=Hylaeus volcanicus TaxID=313075 RepID=UPI0023B84FC4|nr:uncharacterized protein LOC128875006 isoform X1 [Hylaeus volcanicus]